MPCIECDREERDSLDRSDMEVSSDLLPPWGEGLWKLGGEVEKQNNQSFCSLAIVFFVLV